MKKTYNTAWKGFSAKEIDEAVHLLSARLRLHGLSPLNLIANKRVLDAGCGSGRYSIALSGMGARSVDSIDINPPEIEDKRYKFTLGKLEELPYEDNSFDFVFCNGVAHYVEEPVKVFKELYRVTNKGGLCWILVAKQSKYWAAADRVYKKLDDKDVKGIKRYLEKRGWDKGKIFFILDSFCVDRRHYYTEEQFTDVLKGVGFSEITILKKDIEKNGTEFNLRVLARK